MIGVGRGSGIRSYARSDVDIGMRSQQRPAELRNADERIQTPVNVFLSSNITPRSGSRRARAETASPSPQAYGSKSYNSPAMKGSTISGTGDSSLRQPMKDVSGNKALTFVESYPGKSQDTALYSSNRNVDIRSSGMPTDNDARASPFAVRPNMTERSSTDYKVLSAHQSPSFFHANDVMRPSTRGPPPRSVPGLARRGISVDSPTPSELPFVGKKPITSIIESSTAGDGTETRPGFFRVDELNANHGMGQDDPLPVTPVASRPQLHRIQSERSTLGSPHTRSMSPLRQHTPQIGEQRSSVQRPAIQQHTRSMTTGWHAGSPVASNIGLREVQDLRSRNSSISSLPPMQHVNLSSQIQSTQNAKPQVLNTPAVANNVPMTAVANRTFQKSFDNHTSSAMSVNNNDRSHYDTRSSGGSYEEGNELAAKARRDRKLLDLEISNSSLLAINRTLERQMRKQTAELRRFRRLESNGLIRGGEDSLGNDLAQQIFGDQELSGSEDGPRIVGRPSWGRDDTTDGVEEISSNHSSPSNRLSSNTNASSFSKSSTESTRFLDPVIPPLDFSGQRQLLVEAQKLNQSISRCLWSSETMLKSGRATLQRLAEPMNPEDIGPRVVCSDEDDERDEEAGHEEYHDKKTSSFSSSQMMAESHGSEDSHLSHADYAMLDSARPQISMIDKSPDMSFQSLGGLHKLANVLEELSTPGMDGENYNDEDSRGDDTGSADQHIDKDAHSVDDAESTTNSVEDNHPTNGANSNAHDSAQTEAHDLAIDNADFEDRHEQDGRDPPMTKQSTETQTTYNGDSESHLPTETEVCENIDEEPDNSHTSFQDSSLSLRDTADDAAAQRLDLSSPRDSYFPDYREPLDVESTSHILPTALSDTFNSPKQSGDDSLHIDSVSTTSEPNAPDVPHIPNDDANNTKPARDTMPSEPGNRGSFQHLGNYLSSFGKFAGNLRPG